jgi:hypothetical protein
MITQRISRPPTGGATEKKAQGEWMIDRVSTLFSCRLRRFARVDMSADSAAYRADGSPTVSALVKKE